MLKKIQVNKALNELIESTYLDWFAIEVKYEKYIDDGNSVKETFTVDKYDTLQEISEMFGTWYYVYDDSIISWLPVIPEKPQSAFADCFRRYKEHCDINLSKMLSAYKSEYNPIENYNGVENSTESFNNYKDEKEISGKVKTNVNVENKNMTGEYISDNTLQGYATSIHSESSFESDDVKVVNKDESKGTVVNNTQADSNSNYTEWENYKESNQKTGSKTNTLTKHGNLGVTTNQKMINEELELRKHDIFENWLKEFANKHLILSYDDDEESGCCYGY